MKRKTCLLLLALMLCACGSTSAEAVPQHTASPKIIRVTCGEKTLTFEPAGNASAEAFVQRLTEGDVTVSMHDYGDFEKVGDLGFALPRSDEPITTAPGDVILYQGTSVTLYYDQNEWTFTRLGTIPGMTRESMLDFFGGAGDVTVTFSLE